MILLVSQRTPEYPIGHWQWNAIMLLAATALSFTHIPPFWHKIVLLSQVKAVSDEIIYILLN